MNPGEQLKPHEPLAEAILHMAQQYHRAATSLLGRDAESPLYFLYAHTIELALKAYQRSHGLRPPHSHDLPSLLQTCQELGLPVPRDLTNVIALLNTENCIHGFRYFAFSSTSKPEIAYLREVVDAVMVDVANEVAKRPSHEPNAVVAKLTIGKPEQQK